MRYAPDKSVPDGRTDGMTDGRTDGRTGSIPIVLPGGRWGTNKAEATYFVPVRKILANFPVKI